MGPAEVIDVSEMVRHTPGRHESNARVLRRLVAEHLDDRDLAMVFCDAALLCDAAAARAREASA